MSHPAAIAGRKLAAVYDLRNFVREANTALAEVAPCWPLVRLILRKAALQASEVARLQDELDVELARRQATKP